MTATVRLTMAQAVVRYLCNQFTVVDGEKVPLFPGVFAIFGHGNVTCLSEALEAVKDTLPTWRGQNEQSMALAAIGFAKARRRRQIMVATTSIGPGALNMVTAAGVAHSNRLPVLMFAGDTFVNRRPDPVMQQVEHFGDPTVNVNDAFKAVTRYWDRIVHPEQIISSLPQAVAVLLDPADCGPAFIALPQDALVLSLSRSTPAPQALATDSDPCGGVLGTLAARRQLGNQFAPDSFRRQSPGHGPAGKPLAAQAGGPRLGKAPVIDKPQRHAMRDHFVEQRSVDRRIFSVMAATDRDLPGQDPAQLRGRRGITFEIVQRSPAQIERRDPSRRTGPGRALLAWFGFAAAHPNPRPASTGRP